MSKHKSSKNKSAGNNGSNNTEIKPASPPVEVSLEQALKETIAMNEQAKQEFNVDSGPVRIDPVKPEVAPEKPDTEPSEPEHKPSIPLENPPAEKPVPNEPLVPEE